MTYREKDYFVVVRTKEDMVKSPFMLFVVRGSSKQRLEQEIQDGGFVPFQNKLMTREQFVRQDEKFFERTGIRNAQFEADVALTIRNFYAEHKPEDFTKLTEMITIAEGMGYGNEHNIYTRLVNAVVMA